MTLVSQRMASMGGKLPLPPFPKSQLQTVRDGKDDLSKNTLNCLIECPRHREHEKQCDNADHDSHSIS